MRQLAPGGQVEVLCLAVTWFLLGCLSASVPVLIAVDVWRPVSDTWTSVFGLTWVVVLLACGGLRMAAAVASPVKPAHLRPSDREW